MKYREFKFTVTESDSGVQAKTFLRGACAISARTLAKLKRTPGGITVNGKPLRAIDTVFAGDEIRLALPEDTNEITPVNGRIEILYEDEYIIALNKPANMPVHPVKSHQSDTLANLLSAYMIKRGENYTFRAVNRLDKDTSGIVLAAKDRITAAKLAHDVRKQYFAICEGEIYRSGKIDLPVSLAQNSKMLRTAGCGGSPAVTLYTPVKSLHGCTLLNVRTETGRTHQIRCHLSHICHPLAGDDLYGGSRNLIGRQALHCAQACFVHPVTGAELEIRAPVPEDFFIRI